MLVSHVTDDVSMSMDTIRAGIAYAMDNNLLLNPTTMPTVTRIIYYGASEDDFLAIGGATRATGSTTNFTPVIVVGIVGATLVALMLLLLRKRRRVVTERQLESGLALAAADEDSADGDPEGAFHQGYYHYTRDGVRYLSPYCQTCLETERQLALGHGLETISEDEEFMEGRLHKLVPANSKDLGGVHSSMDVHGCTSATCQQCADRRNSDLNFVKWKIHQDGSVETTPSADGLDTISEGSSPIPSPRSKSGNSVEV